MGVGGQITMVRAHTLDLDRRHLPSSPSPSIRAGIWRRAPPRAPRQLPSLTPPSRAFQTPEANSQVDKTWGKGQVFFQGFHLSSLANRMTAALAGADLADPLRTSLRDFRFGRPVKHGRWLAARALDRQIRLHLAKQARATMAAARILMQEILNILHDQHRVRGVTVFRGIASFGNAGCQRRRQNVPDGGVKVYQSG